MIFREFRKLKSLWLEAGGCMMHARVSADPPGGTLPVVLVHGLGVSSRYMVPVAVQLSRDFPVYAPDLPGFGRSQRPGRTPGISGLAEALIAWMDAAGLQRAALLGNSVGCQITVDAAVRFPDRVRCAILHGPTVDRYARSWTQQSFALFLDAFREPLSQVAIVTYDYLCCGPVRLWQTFRDALRDPIEEKLARVPCPALVVRGARDPIVSQHWAEDVAALLPRGELVVIPGAPHTANYSKPLELARVVRAFLQRQPLQ